MPFRDHADIFLHAKPVVIGVPVLILLVVVLWPVWVPLVMPPPPPPFTYYDEPFRLVHPERPVHPGEAPELLVGRCNNTGAEFTYSITRIVVRETDHRQWYLPGGDDGRGALQATVPPGCTLAVSQAHTLPDDLPPGRYYLEFVADLPFGNDHDGRVQSVIGRTQTFDVVPR